MSNLEDEDRTVRYHVAGSGSVVVMVMGLGATGSVWQLHQVPALVGAGYQVVTYDARGVNPIAEQTDMKITTKHLVDEVAWLIEDLDAGPAHVVGTSLGARTAQELALGRPELVNRVVALGAHARVDATQRLLIKGKLELFDQSVALPPAYQAAVEALVNLSPATLKDEAKIADWLDIMQATAKPATFGNRAQIAEVSRLTDRRAAYEAITRPLLAVGFADDMTIPPYLSREVADAVPGAEYAEVADAGHFGYLEQPGAVNKLILEFLGRSD